MPTETLFSSFKNKGTKDKNIGSSSRKRKKRTHAENEPYNKIKNSN
jgi:hypothetical protein